MPLGPKTKAFFENLKKNIADNPIKPMAELSIQEFRKDCNENFRKYSAGFPEGVKESDFVNVSLMLGGQNVVQIQTYTPSNVDQNIPLPVLIYFHGGGFCLNLNVHQGPCALIANQAQCKVIAIDYPLAPEHTQKQITNICYNTVKYIYEHCAQFNIDKEKLIIGGCSSGGTIAAGITNRALKDKDIKIYQQILISPLVDLSLETHRKNPFLEYQKEDIMLSDEALEYFVKTYVPNSADRKSPTVSPLYWSNFSGLPDTTIIVGEYDALRAEGTRYKDKLSGNGNHIDFILCEGQTHNFMSCRAVLDDGENPAELVAKSIRQKLTQEKKISLNCV